MMRFILPAVFTAMVVLDSGCTGLPDKIHTGVDATQSKATRLARQVGQYDTETKARPSVVHDNGIWIARNAIKIQPQDNLPPIFYEAAVFDRTVYSLSEFAERITIRSGLPTKIAPDAITISNRTLYPAALMPMTSMGTANGNAPSNMAFAPPTGPGSPLMAGNMASNTSAPSVRIVYSNGNLKGLLDTATARFGVFWKFENGAVQFYYTDTRTFQISAIPGDSALSATVASGSASGTSGSDGGTSGAKNGVNSDNSQNTAVKSQLSVFSNMEKSISIMLSQYGQVMASPSTGSITVTDTPDKLNRIAQYIENENKSLARQIMVNVTVLAVTVSNGDNFGINWNLVYGDLFHKYGVQNTAANSNVNSTSFSAGILSTANSKWAGSSLVIDALASQGKVRRETTASVVTLNNQPVPVQVARQTTYLKSSETTITANVGATTTLNPGTVTSGFNMTILPHVLDNGTVLLQFSTDISALRRIRTVSSNQSLIESPELDTRNFLQRVAMKSNETLIISGFEQTDENLDMQGTGKPGNVLLGGGYNAQSNKEVIVILITPVAMNSI